MEICEHLVDTSFSMTIIDWFRIGTMDLRTNYREDYLIPEMPIKRSASHVTKEVSVKDQNVYTRRPMNSISQTSFDFRPYTQQRPAKPADMEPFISQITLGNTFTSVQKFVLFILSLACKTHHSFL